MKKKRIGLLTTCLLAVAVSIGWRALSDYSRVIEANWGITLPWQARLTEVYQRDSGASFHGDGVRYHVYSYQYEDYIDLMFAWPPTEYPTNYYATTSEAAGAWLDEIDVPADKRPNYANCSSWHTSQKDNSEIIFFWDSEQNLLYIVENFI